MNELLPPVHLAANADGTFDAFVSCVGFTANRQLYAAVAFIRDNYSDQPTLRSVPVFDQCRREWTSEIDLSEA